MKTSELKQHMVRGLLGIFTIASMLSTVACSSGSGSGNSAAVAATGLTGYCTACSSYTAGPTLLNGPASSPYGTITSPGIEVVADAAGYSAAQTSGLPPLTNGTYMAAVTGTVTINQAQTCANSGIQVPAGTYTLEMTSIGTVTNGNYYAQMVNLVGPTTIPGSVWVTFVDANLDNVADPGTTLIAIGFCGQWHDMLYQ